MNNFISSRTKHNYKCISFDRGINCFRSQSLSQFCFLTTALQNKGLLNGLFPFQIFLAFKYPSEPKILRHNQGPQISTYTEIIIFLVVRIARRFVFQLSGILTFKISLLTIKSVCYQHRPAKIYKPMSKQNSWTLCNEYDKLIIRLGCISQPAITEVAAAINLHCCITSL